MSASAMPFVLKSNYISVVVDGRPFQLLGSHPTFKRMARALKGKRWDRVPALVNAAQSISNRSHGNVEVRGGEVFYKGSKIDSSLTKRMVRFIEHGKPVANLLRFMDNLFKNPDQDTIRELYDFLERYALPITDDGCFVAYKRVDKDYMDMHTNSVDNHVGQVVFMPRKAVDTDRTTPCSSGYHFCSREYLHNFPGEHLMAIKINPADVGAVPESNIGKGRTWRYEVISEVPNEDYETEDAAYFQRPLISVGRDRKALIRKLLALPMVKRLVARTERAHAEARLSRRRIKTGSAHPKVEVAGLTKKAVQKAALGRLQLWYQRFNTSQIPAPEQSPLFGNPTRPARVAAKLSIVRIAKEMGVRASEVYRTERAEKPSQRFIDNYLGAIMRIKGRLAGMAYPASAARATA